MIYDQNNVFAKILRGDIAATRLYEDEQLIAINDINPAAAIHILVIPKNPYVDFSDFIAKAKATEISHYFKIIAKLAKENGANYYRLVTNKGKKMGQSVFHFHTHILSDTSASDIAANDLTKN